MPLAAAGAAAGAPRVTVGADGIAAVGAAATAVGTAAGASPAASVGVSAAAVTEPGTVATLVGAAALALAAGALVGAAAAPASRVAPAVGAPPPGGAPAGAAELPTNVVLGRPGGGRAATTGTLSDVCGGGPLCEHCRGANVHRQSMI